MIPRPPRVIPKIVIQPTKGPDQFRFEHGYRFIEEQLNAMRDEIIRYRMKEAGISVDGESGKG